MSLITQTVKYALPGIYTYTVPQGVGTLEFFLWGAGGAGGSNGTSTQVSQGPTVAGTVQTDFSSSTTTGPTTSGSLSFSTNGTWTVPQGVTSITVTATGGGGGGGGADGGAAGGFPNGGYPGSRVTAKIPVVAGQIIKTVIGFGGAGGQGRATSAAPGAGGAGYSAGGRGGYSGPQGTSGAGGGGGGSTALLVNGVVVLVAAGGGGASGSGNGNYGIGATGSYNSTSAGAIGGDKTGDGGGGGGGGAGYPLGGAGGPVRAGDLGAYSGTTGQSLVPPGGTSTSAGNGGYYISGAGGAGSLQLSWTGTTVVAVNTPTYTTVYKDTFRVISGGTGGLGASGGYSSRKIQVSEGDEIVLAVGGAGIRYAGGSSLVTPYDFSGGDAGVASSGSRGGGGGGATVLLVNGTVVAVAAGGGGGGGGGTSQTNGGNGTGAKISGLESGESGKGKSSVSGPSTGGGGGGGFYSGKSGSSGSVGSGGNGGVSYGTIIQEGSLSAPGGMALLEYPGNNVGYPGYGGAATLIFTKSFNINVKQDDDWKNINRSWVKTNGEWREIINGWTKVNGNWLPLISPRSIEGAENLANPAITYTLSANVGSVNEGDTVQFTLLTTGLDAGAIVPYHASGVDAIDLAAGNLSGSFVVGTTDSITFTPKLNHTTNGVRRLVVSLDNNIVSAGCEVIDSSLTPVYGITGNVSQVDEGSAVRFTLSNINGVVGETINYSISGITASRLTTGSTYGKFIVGSSESVDIAVSNNLKTDGASTMVIKLEGKGARTYCAINDTSTTPSGFRTYTSLYDNTWIVPLDVTSVQILAVGGGGGAGTGAAGGGAAAVYGTVAVNPGDTFTIGIGNGGKPGVGATGGAGGQGPTGFNGGTGGYSTDIYNTSIYPVSVGAWSSFLNTYGVWGGGQDYSVAVNFPVSGTYTFNFSVDNYGSISVDGSVIINRTGEYNYSSSYTTTATISAGNHVVRVRGFNYGGPAGVAAQIINPNNSELWNTRNLLSNAGLYNPIYGAGQVGTGGGGGGGGAASVVYINGILRLVAGGGGGGGGYGNNGAGGASVGYPGNAGVTPTASGVGGDGRFGVGGGGGGGGGNAGGAGGLAQNGPGGLGGSGGFNYASAPNMIMYKGVGTLPGGGTLINPANVYGTAGQSGVVQIRWGSYIV